ncbi:energy transducer TonB [Undibacterium pigrum]|uniref:Protein TonB n=1 Tax=Undibacterium pigrum TaxID=401470 RepID=A0A318JU96_9BURK|nr:energy transducer TonB [Undibacterium pigrum]PXX44058.1 outer membrane transport energization protein TonB [Undibacterium pigrum]
MSTMTFESSDFFLRKAAVRRSNRVVPKAKAAQELPPVKVATVLPAQEKHGKLNWSLNTLIVAVAGVHVALVYDLHQPINVSPVEKARVVPLSIEIAPPPVKELPPPPPPEIKPKLQPQIKPVAAPTRAATPDNLPVVNTAPVDTVPSANTVAVAVAAPPAPPAPAVATLAPPAPPEPVTEPKGYAGYLQNPAPNYPPAAQRRGLEGQVTLKVHVLASGHPANIQIAKSSSHPILDEAAIKAVTSWVFQPAKRGQTAIDGWVHVPLIFKL